MILFFRCIDAKGLAEWQFSRSFPYLTIQIRAEPAETEGGFYFI